jgi:cytoskeleton protein RodZ
VSDDETGAGIGIGIGIGIGERLAAARTALGLGEEDVADALNLSARVILDLESQAWDSLPAPAFTRGYIRAYAKLLELDGEELIRGYERVAGVADTVELELPVSSARPRAGVGELLQRQPGTVLSGAVVAGVALVLLLVWAVWPSGEAERGRIDASRTAELVQAEAAQTTEPPRQTELPRVVEVPEYQPDEPVLGAPARVPLVEPVAAVPEVSEVSAPYAAIEPVAGSTRVRRLTPTGEDRLRLEFSADCWVEVKDEANLNLYGDLGRAGDSLELVGTAPFRVLLGYAPGVVLEYNGESVPLAGYTRNNVAALWLGRP